MSKLVIFLLLSGVCFSVYGILSTVSYYVRKNPARYTKLEGRIYDVNPGTVEVYSHRHYYTKAVFYPVIEYEFQGKLMRQQASWYSESALAYKKGDCIHITVSNRDPRKISETVGSFPGKYTVIAFCIGIVSIAAALLIWKIGGMNGNL